MNRRGNPGSHVHGVHSHPADTFRDWLSYFYGGWGSCEGGARESRGRRDRRVRSDLTPSDKAKEEALEKERERNRERRRISEEEAEKSPTLTIKHVDLCVGRNTQDHHTDRYMCTLGKKPQPVLRRGQEFMVTLTFDRPYRKNKDDLLFILSAEEDETSPGKKNLRVKFVLDEDRKGQYAGEKDWCARLVDRDAEQRKVTVAVYIPGDCVVGEWDLKVRTRLLEGSKVSLVYECPTSLIILFNPWSEADQVHYNKDKWELDEYVLNAHGIVYKGSSGSFYGSQWTYGQFDREILLICLSLLRKAFGFKMTPDMADPVLVSRALSRIVNSQDDNGVLVGNWTDSYAGGRSPSSWDSSLDILKQFHKSEQPVKWGQCWVFSHVLTAVCRALGLPCRSVTNFKSAHDTDRTCTIDTFLDVNGDPIPSCGGDSIWNFHVWSEVWMLRPDLLCHGQYDGWHVIDATPQESSQGLMQCGPCPVAAVKRGELTVGFDTAFVFSEVNAEQVQWSAGPDGEFDVISNLSSFVVGQNISTKPPDGMEHSNDPDSRIVDYPVRRMDITLTYKYPEGSTKEREATKRAISYTRYGDKLFKKGQDLQVKFEPPPKTAVGKDLVLTALVTNVSGQEREVAVSMAARTCHYWNNTRDSKKLAQQKFPHKAIKAGQTERFSMTVTMKQYLEVVDEHLTVYGYVCARDLLCDMPYTDQEDFNLTAPELQVVSPKTAVSGQVLTVSMSFSNPLPFTLTQGTFWVSTDLSLAPDDKSPWENYYSTLRLKFRDVKIQEKVTLTVRLVGNMEEGQKDTDMAINGSFECDQLSALFKGGCTIKMKAQ